jgi:tRNA threonylcarbamoyladenosine biosynthesis protein TsaB
VSAPSPARAAPGSAAWLLAFDASTPRCVIAVGWVDVAAGAQALVVADDEDEAADQASVRLMPRIARALALGGIEARALAAVACGRGPGTFTGSRVAVASAMGLAYGLGRPVVPVSTLAAMAASAGHEGTVLAVLDARRGEVYGGCWRCGGSNGEGLGGSEQAGMPRVEALGEERVATLGAWLEEIAPWPAGLRVVGSGAAAYADAVPPELAGAVEPLPGPTAAGLWAASVAAWADGQARHPAALEAVYLRASYAELATHTPKRPFVKSPFV